MRTIALVVALCCGIIARGDDTERWEIIRPSVFPLLLEAKGERTPRFAEIESAIKAAAKLHVDGEDAILPSSIENIVVLEEETRWLVAFFRRGNDRTFLMRDGEFYFRPLPQRNHRVVAVSKVGFEAHFSEDRVAYPWHPKVDVDVAVKYPDETKAERSFREMDFAGSMDAERQTEKTP